MTVALDTARLRVIASDLDGTLLGADHELTPRTVDVLRAARERGFYVIAATGRAPRSAMDKVATHDVADVLVCSNGSIIHDIASDSTVHRFPIDPDHLSGLFTELDRAVPGLSYGWEMADSSAWDAEFDDIARRHDDLHPFGIARRPGRHTSVTKVLVRHQTVVRTDLAELLEPHLPAALTLGCSGADFVEITGVGVDKSRAIAHLVGQRGHSASDVVAFGDNHNDREMLMWAGLGVAVDNAVSEARAAADHVIGDHRDDAVADFIESLL